MFSEAFFSRLMYKETMCKKKQQPEGNNIHKNTGSIKGHSENMHGSLLEKETPNVFNAKGEVRCYTEEEVFVKSTEQLYSQRHGGTIGHASEALYIPKNEHKSENQVDLYTSWSSMYASIYKNYPDLHIGGDHILNKKDSGCVLDLDCEIQDGPVLHSIDIVSGSTPPVEVLEEPPGLVNTLQCEENREKSITFPNAPFSNSVVNSYMESKMRELYKQFLEENLMINGSPTPLLFSSMIMNNVNQISKHISQEQNVEQTKAREAILNCLRSAASGISSEFLTPVLHISNVDSNKNSEMLTKTSNPHIVS
ncbi:TLR adapter interacting with SLC15A4 on the lysosome-like [Rhinophrynus dorsalis]